MYAKAIEFYPLLVPRASEMRPQGSSSCIRTAVLRPHFGRPLPSHPPAPTRLRISHSHLGAPPECCGQNISTWSPATKEKETSGAINRTAPSGPHGPDAAAPVLRTGVAPESLRQHEQNPRVWISTLLPLAARNHRHRFRARGLRRREVSGAR